jgi:hypothetical protein
MPQVEICMKISRKTKSTQGIPIYLKIPDVAQIQRTKKIFKATHQPEGKKDCIIVYLKKNQESCLNV